MSAPPIYLADDDDAIRRSMVMLLEDARYRVRAFDSGEGFLAALDCAEELPGCAVLDVRMGGMTGLDVQRTLASRSGQRLPVVMVTGHADVPLAVAAMRAGVADFIEKPYPPDRLLNAVAEVLAAPSAPPAATVLPPLTPRELDVLTALVTGRSNKEIARELGISHRTVEVHRASLMGRLGARNLAEAVRIGLAAGLGN